jgi:hypothetical protein
MVGTPDLSRGGGFGTPEQKMEELERRHEEAAQQIEADRMARRALEKDPSRRPWYKRLFGRS